MKLKFHTVPLIVDDDDDNDDRFESKDRTVTTNYFMLIW